MRDQLPCVAMLPASNPRSLCHVFALVAPGIVANSKHMETRAIHEITARTPDATVSDHAQISQAQKNAQIYAPTRRCAAAGSGGTNCGIPVRNIIIAFFNFLLTFHSV